MAIEEFSRDLGYLDKFFEKLEGHASTVGGNAGGRLLELLAEERKRWDEIRGLLGGAPGVETTAAVEASPTTGADAVEPTRKPAPASPSSPAPAPAPSGDLEDLAPVAVHAPHPYTRALQMGLSALPKAELREAPAPRGATPRAQQTFTVGSLRRKS